MEDRVILDTIEDLRGPQGSYPEGFVSFSLFLAEIYKFVVLVKKRHMIHTDIHTYTQTMQKFNIDVDVNVMLFLDLHYPKPGEQYVPSTCYSDSR